MAMLSQPAFGPRMSLIYITVGALLDVWTAVWYFAFLKSGDYEMSNRAWFWLVGLFLTGLTLILIGALLGTIGQAARRAELPPEDAIDDEKDVKKAAGNPPPAAPAAAGPVPVMPQPVYYPQVAPPAPGQPMPPPAPSAPAPAAG